MYQDQHVYLLINIAGLLGPPQPTLRFLFFQYNEYAHKLITITHRSVTDLPAYVKGKTCRTFEWEDFPLDTKIVLCTLFLPEGQLLTP